MLCCVCGHTCTKGGHKRTVALGTTGVRLWKRNEMRGRLRLVLSLQYGAWGLGWRSNQQLLLRGLPGDSCCAMAASGQSSLQQRTYLCTESLK